jgi:hypothetical protein
MIRLRLYLFCLYICLILTCQGCNFSITMVHTNGEATDVVDEEEGATADLAIKPGLLP